MDISVQFTRPTSKTAMLVRQKRALLETLSCFLCKGYLIDATTIDECMDSFCRSCIIIYLRNNSNCPKCEAIIHRTNPLSSLHSDKVLQDIVYKMVPGLYDDEMQRRREFYEDEDRHSSGSAGDRSLNLTNEQSGIISHPKPFYKLTDQIDLSIEPQERGNSSSVYYDNKRHSIFTCLTGNLEHQPANSTTFSLVDGKQFKTYLRCPAKLTTMQLKKFTAAKFNISPNDTIHLLYLNESLKDEYSLIDIAYIYYWKGIEHMRLFYIIERDLSKSNLMDYPIEGQSRKTRPRQSIGTSTQTVKKVCIDPQPRYYEEHNDNNNNINNPRRFIIQNSNTSNNTNNNNNNNNINNHNNNIRNNSNNDCNSNRQLVPSMRQGNPTIASTMFSPSQSSLVTLASFTQARSNNVITMSSASTATIPNSHASLRDSRVLPKVDIKTNDSKESQITAQTKASPQSASQLAYSFITREGVTMIRRLNCQDEKASSTANHNFSNNITNQSTSSGIIRTQQQPSSTANSASSSASRSNSSSSRHLMKEKPVYKTFVDPTKLKSPNFKKLGLTARH